jgi:uncharacterized protein DUF6794
MPAFSRGTAWRVLALAGIGLAHSGSPASGQDTAVAAAEATQQNAPKTLEEALTALDTLFTPRIKQWIDSVPESDMIQFHFSTGLWMRNNWGLWGGGPLARYFNGIGIYHPDDMSGIILTSYWRRHHSQDLRLDEQVKSYKAYWAKQPEYQELH